MLLKIKIVIFSNFNLILRRERSVLCRSCGCEVADPGLLYTRTLSPQFLERRNLTRLFGSSLPVTVERLRNPAGREFQVVSFQKAGTVPTRS